MSVLALGFVACDDYDEALPQSNPQAPITSVNGLTVAPGSDLIDALNLNNVQTTHQLTLVNTTATPALNAGTGVDYDVQIAADETFAEYKQYKMSDGAIQANNINAAFRSFYGKTPNAKPLWFRFIPYLTDGTSRVAFAKDTYLMATKVVVTPIDLGIVIDPAYYVVTDVWFGDGWDKSLIKLDHADTDLYDDPIFSATVELKKGSIQFIGSKGLESAKADPDNSFLYVWGAANDNSTSGDLAYGEAAMAINIAEDGLYSITIDMLNNTFKVAKVVPTMYMIGDFCGWDWKNASTMVPAWANDNGAKDSWKYWVLAFVGENKGFKFNTNAAWDGGEFGYNGASLVSNVAGVDFVNDNGNIALSKAGWYLFGVEKKLGNAGFEFVVNVFAPNVYVYGSCAGGVWNDDANWLFNVPTTADGVFTSKPLAADGELRLCVHPLNSDNSQWLGDWWQSEFIFFGDAIAYRGTGGDQQRVNAGAGQVVSLNFTTGKAALK